VERGTRRLRSIRNHCCTGVPQTGSAPVNPGSQQNGRNAV
jgi:hypothetical protein